MSFAALLLLAQVATATPAQAAQAPLAATPAVAAQKSKTICVVEDETGSRLSGNRVCRSKTEWDQVRGEILETLNLRQRNTQK